MKSALTTASVALLLCAGLVGCGDDDDPAVESTPVVSTAPDSSGAGAALTGKDLECKNEIVRQMADPSKVTDDVPPECEGVGEDRIGELLEIASDELDMASPEPS